MGISIHYKGGIDRPEQIPELIEELADIAESMDWMHQLVGTDEAEPNFRGIIINPKGECEPLCFIFDRDGRLRSLAALLTNQIEAKEYSYYCATKTQYAPLETHIWIVGLLRYLKKHYLGDLIVTDEGDYWETGNRETLIEKKQFLGDKIGQVSKGLDATGLLPNSIDEIIAHIESIIRNRAP